DGGTAPPPLPGTQPTDHTTLAIAGHGRRVAIASCDRVRAWALDGAAWRVVLDRALPPPEGDGPCTWVAGLAFDRDGARLAVASRTLIVYAEGAPAPTAPAIAYAATPPRGYRAAPNEDLDLVAPEGAAGLPRLVASYRSRSGVEVQVVAFDAREVGVVET